MWRLPLHALTQVGLVTFSAIGLEHYQGTAVAFGPVTLALLAEGAGLALWATVRAHTDTIPFAAVLIAGGLSTAAGWMDLSVTGVVGYARSWRGCPPSAPWPLFRRSPEMRYGGHQPGRLPGSRLIAAVAAGDAFDLRGTSATIAGLLAAEGVLLGITSLPHETDGPSRWRRRWCFCRRLVGDAGDRVNLAAVSVIGWRS
jgi:hypothetical protein